MAACSRQTRSIISASFSHLAACACLRGFVATDPRQTTMRASMLALTGANFELGADLEALL